ncbi:molybdate ABC transporter substrate-binding protein [Qipengyuania sp. JC766]|uniref:molybdate ABC transporter substrate-binding protein n=1 Tax=Qipengyuania sp. JC766 TaxID=3232139 RepID=UPI003458DF7E
MASFCCIVLALAGCAPGQSGGPTVFAAASLRPAMEEIGAAWEARGNEAPVFSFASSSALARQIEQGAPADVFVSADSRWTDFLLAQGSVDSGNFRVVARNDLVLAVPAGAQDTAPDLAGEIARGGLVTGDPATVPLGAYAAEALANLGIADPRGVIAIPAENARAALVLLERGEAERGILYASDVASSDAVEVAYPIPSAMHSPIEYTAVIVPVSGHPQAQAFFDFLASPSAQAIFAKHHLKVP